MAEQLVVSVPEAAHMLDVHKDTVWRWVYARKIESVKVGSSRKIRIAVIRKLLDDNTIPTRDGG